MLSDLYEDKIFIFSFFSSKDLPDLKMAFIRTKSEAGKKGLQMQLIFAFDRNKNNSIPVFPVVIPALQARPAITAKLQREAAERQVVSRGEDGKRTKLLPEK